ncbi:MAG: RidA family protein, partial [Planctomycetota bacterium]
MTRLTTVRHHAPLHAHGTCEVEATVMTTSHATEILVRCAPIASGTSKNGCQMQSRALYEGLAAILQPLGAEMCHVVTEKAFFRNLRTDHDDFQQVRREAYRKRGITGNLLPATTYLGQPPCRPGQDIELQAFALVPATAESARVHSLPAPGEGVSVKLFEVGEARHLYVGNVTAGAFNGQAPGSFRGQSDAIFDAALRIVEGHGVSFSDVLRTWIYLDDIDRDYGELNASRNAFFEREGVRRLPASTGIGGRSHPKGSLCAVDLYALLNPEIAAIEVMETPTLNEAPEYGSSFSRGMKMALPGQTYLFISGTASLDEGGATVHVGDTRGQIERMLLNVEELLRAQGATFADLAQAVTFLKSADDLELYQQICAE